MMRLRGAYFVTFSLLFAGLPVACGSTSSSGPNEEAGLEGGQDGTAGEVGEDAPSEVGVESSMDGGDATVDGTLGSEGGPEAGEAGQDVVAEGGPDAQGEIGPDAPADVGADVAGDVVGDVVEDVPGDVSVEAGADVSTADAAADVGADGSPEAGACKLASADAGATDAGPGGALNWATNFGLSGQTSFAGAAIDPSSGDVVVAGYFEGATNFGGGALLSPADGGSGSSAFVARFDSGGHYKWAKTYDDAQWVYAGSVAVDLSGRVLLGGAFQGNVNFGCGSLSAIGTPDLFVAVLDTTGACAWSKSFGSSGNTQNMKSVAFDPTGNVLLAGRAQAADFGAGAQTGYFIAKFDSTGTFGWSKAFPSTTPYGGPWLAVDSAGSVVLAGAFQDTIDFGGGKVLTTPGADSGDVTAAAFVAKFDSTGAYQWAHGYGDGAGGNDSSISGVATDSCGNIFVAGDFSGTINFGSGTLTASDSAKAYVFLAKVDPSGGGVWNKEFAGSTPSNTNVNLTLGPVAVGAAGGPVVTALLSGDGLGDETSADFGGGPLTAVNAHTMAVAAFDSTGTYRWSYAAGSPSTAQQSSAFGVTTSASRSVVVGAFGSCAAGCQLSPTGTTLVLAGQTLTATSSNDLLVASFNP